MQKLSMEELKVELRRDRLASYVRLRGGWPIPLAGAIYWLVLALQGYRLELGDWAFFAFVTSGLIFPIALLLAKLFKNPFMKDKTATGDVLLPTFISMLLFWTFIVAAAQEGPTLVPLILAVGMSLHWPVIGWSYGRTALFSAHAILRALAVLCIWLQFPEHRLTWLPLSVAVIYGLTVLAIFVDSKRMTGRV